MKDIVVKIGNKDVKVNPTYSIWQWTLKNYDIANMDKWTMQYYDKYVMDCIWKMMIRDGVFKPFVIKSNMVRSITMSEMKRLRIDVQRLLLGSDVLSDTEFNKILNDENQEMNKEQKKK